MSDASGAAFNPMVRTVDNVPDEPQDDRADERDDQADDGHHPEEE